ncbi:MAG: DUF1684 domain-containing protein [Chloroflexi bacterium]|nr:MAG: DUF1684 domain-containing protein [Chloroflexota bacterium]
MTGAGLAQDKLDLADWRRRVGDLYRLSGPDTLRRFRQGRDELLRNHPQSPLALQARQRFNGLRYFDPDPAAKGRCRLEPADPGDPLEIDTGGEDGVITYRRTGRLAFVFNGRPCTLTVFSLVGYGGDTVKNTDGLSLELTAGSSDVTIDFNYAYNPSCAYDARWACPLAPRENWLPVPVRAGEKVFS